MQKDQFLVDVSDIFYFFCSGEGKGVRGTRKGVGGPVFCWKSQEGGLPGERRRGGVEGPGGCLRGFGGGGGG